MKKSIFPFIMLLSVVFGIFVVSEAVRFNPRFEQISTMKILVYFMTIAFLGAIGIFGKSNVKELVSYDLKKEPHIFRFFLTALQMFISSLPLWHVTPGSSQSDFESVLYVICVLTGFLLAGVIIIIKAEAIQEAAKK